MQLINYIARFSWGDCNIICHSSKSDNNCESSGGSRWGTGRPAPPLFLDRSEARKAEQFFFRDCSPPPHPCSQGLDTTLESVFVCFLVRNLMEKFQVQVKLAKPRSPWTGGRFERVIQSLKQMLMAKLDEFPDYSVELALKICLFDYNT